MKKTLQDRTQAILAQFGLDFHVSKEELTSKVSGRDTPYFGLYNDKTNLCINTVKEGYRVSQNEEIVSLVLKGTERFGDKLSVTKAGSLNGGKKVFIQMAMTGIAKVGKDNLTQYITVVDSNDGSTGLSIGIGDEVARCFNQFFRFYKSGTAKFRHTATLEQKLKTIPRLVELALSENMKQIQIYNSFISTPCSRQLANKMVKSILGYDRVITSPAEREKLSAKSINMMDRLYKDIDKEFADCGTNVWALFGGVTRFTTHSIGAPNRDNGKMESVLVGSAYKKNQKALNFCLEQVN